jgi:outer membrane protein assembly factor BamE (lipoprotein component of BamABCDE complex)
MSRLKKSLIACSFIICLVSYLLFTYFNPGREKYFSGLKNGVTVEDFTLVEPGMLEADLLNLLGTPLFVRKIDDDPMKARWYYSQQVQGVWRWPRFSISMRDGMVSVVSIQEFDQIDISKILYYKDSEEEIMDLPIDDE